MKIAEVRVHVLEAALSEPFFWAINEARLRGSAVVEIVTDSGLSGFGECFGPARPCAAMVEAYTPLLLGADALATDLIWGPSRRKRRTAFSAASWPASSASAKT